MLYLQYMAFQAFLSILIDFQLALKLLNMSFYHFKLQVPFVHITRNFCALPRTGRVTLEADFR